jgi:serine phosphatase RsbU (regulator of sigma subunit)
VLYRPKDTVSGDFFWVHKRNHKIIVVAGDCIGHGIPGAFISGIGYFLLHETVAVKGITDPAQILHELDNALQRLFTNKETMAETIDLAVCALDIDPCVLKALGRPPSFAFAGANRPCIVFMNGAMYELKGDRKSVGRPLKQKNADFSYNSMELGIAPGTKFSMYLFSDGLEDQFGGENDWKFTRQRLRELLTGLQGTDAASQLEAISGKLDAWMNPNGKQVAQLDDILLLGFQFEVPNS